MGKVTYIETLDGRTRVEWWEKEQFAGRHTALYTYDTLDDLFADRNARPEYVSPAPDNLILCDFCNASITEFPVPVLYGTHAVCKECFERVQRI